jgi:hypothetical protein
MASRFFFRSDIPLVRVRKSGKVLNGFMIGSKVPIVSAIASPNRPIVPLPRNGPR